MTVGTLIEYLSFFDPGLEAAVCKRARAKLPRIDPGNTVEEEVDIPILCLPRWEIESVMHDTLTRNAPVLLVTQ